jgi:Fe-S-cluster formation regulator IscX/YfhJ
VRKTKKTIDGRTVRYSDWRARVVALAESRQIPDHVRDQVTEPMMHQAWWDNELPDRFLDSVTEYFS